MSNKPVATEDKDLDEVIGQLAFLEAKNDEWREYYRQAIWFLQKYKETLLSGGNLCLLLFAILSGCSEWRVGPW